MIERGNAFVDKTGAIAQLLVTSMYNHTRAFFARPRKFGKSLTLSIAAELLTAGTLPEGVPSWGGFNGIGARKLFMGLQAERFLNESGSLLAEGPHFVVHVDLAAILTGDDMKHGIINILARYAHDAFGSLASSKVERQVSPGEALLELIAAVPRGVPIAVLVDEYDAAIIKDVVKHKWAAARAGIEALGSLLLATKVRACGSKGRELPCTSSSTQGSGHRWLYHVAPHRLYIPLLLFPHSPVCARR